MRRPTQNLGKLSIITVLSIVALLPVFTGFITVTGEKHKAQKGEQPINIEDLMKQVLELNQKNQHQKAIDLLLATADKQAEDSILRTLLVQTFDLLLENEIKQGQKDIQKNPRNMTAYMRVSGALELVGDKFRAMEILLNGLRYHPNSAALWMKIGRLELRADRNNEALDVFREVTRLDGKNSDAYNNAAYLLVRTENCDADDLKEAEHFASSARKLDPKNPEYMDTLAEVFFKQGNTKMAQSLIEEALKISPEKDALKNQLRRFQSDRSLQSE